jgi:hypothetical protein
MKIYCAHPVKDYVFLEDGGLYERCKFCEVPWNMDKSKMHKVVIGETE